MKKAFALFLGILTVLLSVCSVWAAPLEMPASLKGKTVTWYVGLSAGGTTDVAARTLARIINEQTGLNMVIENIEGGSASIAMIQCLTSPADGTAVYSCGSGIFALMGLGDLEYTVDDMTWISSLYSNTQGIFVRKDSPIVTIEDFVQAVRNGKPGQYPCGVPGAVTPGEATIIQLGQLLEAEEVLFPVNLPGASRVLTELLGGNVEFMMGAAGDVGAALDNGDIRQIFIGTYERQEGYEDVPAITEFDFWGDERAYLDHSYVINYLIGPKGMPEDVTAWLAQALRNALTTEEFLEMAAKFTVKVEPVRAGQDAYEAARGTAAASKEFIDRFYK